MIELLASGRSATASRSLASRSATMIAGPLLRISLALATTSPSAGRKVFDELVFLAEKGAALVVVGDGEARTLHAVVGQDRIDQRQRRRLVIGLAEIVDLDVHRRRRSRHGRCRGVGRLLLLGNRAEAEQWKGEQQGGSGAPSACQNAPRKGTGEQSTYGLRHQVQCVLFREGTENVPSSRLHSSIWLRGFRSVAMRRLADRALPGFPDFATRQRQSCRELSPNTYPMFPGAPEGQVARLPKASTPNTGTTKPMISTAAVSAGRFW